MGRDRSNLIVVATGANQLLLERAVMRSLKIFKPVRLALAFLVSFAFSTVSNANCAGIEVVADLQRYGIAAELITEGEDWDKIRIFRDGLGTTVYVEADGHMTFRGWYSKDWKPSLAKANEINDRYKYVVAVFDEDGDLRISYYVRNFEKGCSSFARNHARTWWDIEKVVEGYLEDNM